MILEVWLDKDHLVTKRFAVAECNNYPANEWQLTKIKLN
jgi:hypothetical protein